MSSASPPADRSARKKDPPLLWLGIDFFFWVRLLRKNLWSLSLRRVPLAAAISVCSLLQTLAGWIERLAYGRRIARVDLKDAPVFVIGHWRSGTSLLHELLSLDPRHTFPTNYNCFLPCNFLLTEPFFKPLLSRLIPSQRPQDNMAISLDTPQEDECGLCNMGAPSPYASIAFPNRWEVRREMFDLEGLTEGARQRWERLFVRFLKRVTLARPGRMIVKSPTHTFRIRVLLKLFPDARFVYIIRNPYNVYTSTMHLWRSVCSGFSLQAPDFAGLENYVFELYRFAWQKVEDTRQLVPPGRFCEIRYEDLVKDPEGQVRRLYESLGIDGFESRLLPAIKQYLGDRALYKTNRYDLPPDTIERINRNWGDIIKACGYEMLEGSGISWGNLS